MQAEKKYLIILGFKNPSAFFFILTYLKQEILSLI